MQLIGLIRLEKSDKKYVVIILAIKTPILF